MATGDHRQPRTSEQLRGGAVVFVLVSPAPPPVDQLLSQDRIYQAKHCLDPVLAHGSRIPGPRSPGPVVCTCTTSIPGIGCAPAGT